MESDDEYTLVKKINKYKRMLKKCHSLNDADGYNKQLEILNMKLNYKYGPTRSKLIGGNNLTWSDITKKLKEIDDNPSNKDKVIAEFKKSYSMLSSSEQNRNAISYLHILELYH